MAIHKKEDDWKVEGDGGPQSVTPPCQQVAGSNKTQELK